jgi:hypothetical protein
MKTSFDCLPSPKGEHMLLTEDDPLWGRGTGARWVHPGMQYVRAIPIEVAPVSTDLVLKWGKTGETLNPASVQRALTAISSSGTIKCALTSDNLIRFGMQMPVTDARCVAVEVSFSRGGKSLTASSHGGRWPMLEWCLHALAAQLGAQLFDPQDGNVIPPDSQARLAKAKALLEAHEAEARADEPHDGPEEPLDADDASSLLVAFLESLVASEQLSLAAAPNDFGHLASQLNEPSALYEALLDSPLVDEVFASESQFVRALAEYRTRRA